MMKRVNSSAYYYVYYHSRDHISVGSALSNLHGECHILSSFKLEKWLTGEAVNFLLEFLKIPQVLLNRYLICFSCVMVGINCKVV